MESLGFALASPGYGAAAAQRSGAISTVRRSRIRADSARSPAAQVVERFYGGINSRQLGGASDTIAERCIYEDLVFARPFVGRKDIVEFFSEFTAAISPELTFVIDDISDGELSVGVTWHLDWRGKPFPFSRGCSFYRCQKFGDDYKITYARDCVEPALKVGSLALKVIAGATWIFERFPWLVRA